MELLYGTNNPAKLSFMGKKLAELGIRLIGLKDLGCGIPEVPEDGATPLENARQKAAAYYQAFRMPVFSCDSGLYFDNVPDDVQPGVHVRTVNGKRLTDEEMVAHYAGLAHKYGNLTARYKNAICLILDDERSYEAMDVSMGRRPPFLITEKPYPALNPGFPLDSLSIDIQSGKYYYDLPKEAWGRLAAEDGYLAFFQKVMKETNFF